MKKIYAQIKDGVIINKAVFDSDGELSKGWIDVTNNACNIGDPIIAGVPITKPSKYHTLKVDKTGWEITDENQMQMDEEKVRLAIIREKRDRKNVANLLNLSSTEIDAWIENKISGVSTIEELKSLLKVVLADIIISLA